MELYLNFFLFLQKKNLSLQYGRYDKISHKYVFIKTLAVIELK